MTSFFHQLEELEKSDNPPTPFALNTVRKFLYQLPVSNKGKISRQEDKGICVRWDSGKNYVKLVVPPNSQTKVLIYEYNPILDEESESDSLIDSLFGF